MYENILILKLYYASKQTEAEIYLNIFYFR